MFDAALIESAAHPAGVPGRHAKTLTVAIAFHAAVIAALVLAALASTSEPPEPAIPILFPAFPGGPPPPAGGGGTPVRATLVPRLRVEVPILRMPELPVVASTEGPRDTGPSVGNEIPGVVGDSTGTGDGTDGGIDGGTGKQEGGGLPDDTIYPPHAAGVTAPTVVLRIDPDYPETSRKLQQQGVVILEAVITASGSVDQLRIIGSAGPILDAAAVAAVRQWRYAPATLNGRAVAVFLTVTVRFALNN
jgi:protein TonB